MTKPEWESLCDGCGRCCLNKLEDEETGSASIFTDVACKLLDHDTCRCKDYKNRLKKVPDCVLLTPEEVRELDWLPPTCAYDLLAKGKDLYWWHPLVSGDPETVHSAGISVRGRVGACESQVPDEQLEKWIVNWPGKLPKAAGEAAAAARSKAAAQARGGAGQEGEGLDPSGISVSRARAQRRADKTARIRDRLNARDALQAGSHAAACPRRVCVRFRAQGDRPRTAQTVRATSPHRPAFPPPENPYFCAQTAQTRATAAHRGRKQNNRKKADLLVPEAASENGAQYQERRDRKARARAVATAPSRYHRGRYRGLAQGTGARAAAAAARRHGGFPPPHPGDRRRHEAAAGARAHASADAMAEQIRSREADDLFRLRDDGRAASRRRW